MTAELVPVLTGDEAHDLAEQEAIVSRGLSTFVDVAELPDTLHIGPSSALLIGNLNKARNAWVAISVLNVRPRQMAFDLEAAS